MSAIPEPSQIPDTGREPLQLVGDELAVTLNDARAALEQYAEGEFGSQPLERCAVLLHTARGVLQITETWGASLLAEEMEQTCRHLLKNRRDGQADDGLEALSRAAMQLPAYVERIRDGGRDVPLVLLPLLNDLRAARGRPLLSESTLLLLNVAPGAMSSPVAQPRAPSGEDVAALARSLRPRFQLALLGWIRGESAADALARLRDVVARLEGASRLDVVHQLWWVTGGVLEALADGGLEPGVSVKRLVGQADREMKRLLTQGEQKFASKPPSDLVNNLLYYVARAGSSGPRVVAIREAFNLSGLIPGDEQVEAARQSLAAPSVRLMQTVAAAIRDDLARVKDVLDIYVRTGMERVEELAPQVELLKKIGDTLGVLGLGELREIIQARRGELDELVSGQRPPEELSLVGMAAALLTVEDRLEHDLIQLIGAEGSAPAQGDEPQPPGDHGMVTQAVMRECLANLARVKEAISQVTERGGDGAALDAIPALLRGITAALLIVERERAGRVAERIAAAAAEVVQGQAGPEARAALERLADAIVSLEYYMETLAAGRREPAWMLDNAARSLEALVLPAQRDTDATAVAVFPDIPYPATQVIERPGPSPDRPVVADTADGIDPEILELFIEEAREAIQSLHTQFPAWEVDEGEREALLTMRRAFHTLKGSGRMVGAQLIGEYCWSVESLLNRVIDGTVLRSPELVDFLRRAIPAVAELLEQLEVGEAPASDIARLMAEAEALSRAQPPAAESAAAGDATELLPIPDIEARLRSAPPPASAPAAPPRPAMDPVLLDILSREVAAHLAVIRDFVDQAGDATLQAVPEEVFRTCHTLHGSLTMAGVMPAVAVAGPLNDLMATLHTARLPADQPVLQACAEAAEAVAAIVRQLGEPALPVPDTGGLTARLQALAAASAERVAAEPAEAADGGTMSLQIPVLADTDLPLTASEAEALLDEPGFEAEGAADLLTGMGPGPDDLAAAEAELTGVFAPGAGPPLAAGPQAGPPPPAQAELEASATAVGWDAEVAGIYAEEAAELLESCDQALERLATGSDAEPALAELQRALHTLKGGARMAGLFAMGDLSHDLETLLTRVADGLLPRDVPTFALVQAALDELHVLRDQIPAGIAAGPSASLQGRLAAVLRGELLPAAVPSPAEPPPGALPPAAREPASQVPAAPEPLPEPEFQAEPVAELPTEAPAAVEATPEPWTEPDVTVVTEFWAAPELAQPQAWIAPEAPPEAQPEPPPEPAAESPVGVESPWAPAGEPEPPAGAGPPAFPPPLVPEPVAFVASDESAAGLIPAEPEAAELESLATAGLPDEAPPEFIPPAEALPEPALPPGLPPALERLGELARELEAPPVPAAPAEAPPAPRPARESRAPESRDFARVESGLLEQLLNGAGEISIANARLSQHLSQIQFNLEELNQTVVRLRDQLRNLEIETEAQILFRHQTDAERDAVFDPLELDRYSSIQQLSRALAETANDVSSLKDLLQNLSADTEGLLVQQARTTNELQDGLMRTRMVPFDQHGSRLARLVRQTAKEQGKQVELTIEGSGDLDRQVLERLLPPFEHMLRNAVVHGIESPAEREVLGKPATGLLRIAIRREGAEVVIDIADDGRGLDIAAIRRKAIELGFVGRDTQLTDEEAMQFILRSGFSTADQLTQAAGRGIGMDVVANQVAKLGGTLAITSQRGRGTTFTMRLPFTLAVTQALIVRAAGELFALPLPTVEGIIRISRREFAERMANAEPAIDYGGQRYFFRHLGQFLGLGPSRLPEDLERVSIILVRAGENSTALITDEMQDSREIVVKPVGAQLATIRGIAGATILGDGRIVVILDVGALVRSARPAPDAPLPEPAREPDQTLALVVDDSITMRRVTQRLLERNGFRVLTAKDGLEAITVLQDHRPDIILLDVEMPRMDGYEFARHVRANAETAKVPIIMVTSRVSEKHRARAIELGVNDYLGKPYQERELLEAVTQLLARL